MQRVAIVAFRSARGFCRSGFAHSDTALTCAKVAEAGGSGLRFASTDSLKGASGLKVTAVLYDAGPIAKEEPRLLGCVENELGLREFLESRGHSYIVTSDKEGPDCELERHLEDTDILITTPFWPAYITEERISKAKKLKMALTAGIGSDHVNLPAAAAAGLTVAEVTGSNTVSVAEHVIMMILSLVRNYMPAHKQVLDGEWDIGRIAAKAFDLENKVVGTVGAGRIGQLVLKRLGGFDCKKLLYYDYAKLDSQTEKSLKASRCEQLEDLIKQCDVVTINCPLHDGTRGLFNRDVIGKMKPGSYLVNTARGAICDTDAVKEALESGHLAGYAGDVWQPQPAPKDHPWRSMPHQAMTPHYSGTTLDAQMRYTAGVKDILQRSFDGKDLRRADIIVEQGRLAPQYDAAAKAEERDLKHEAGWEKLAGDATAGEPLS